jgi:hypothetical protein
MTHCIDFDHGSDGSHRVRQLAVRESKDRFVGWFALAEKLLLDAAPLQTSSRC